MSIKVTLKNGDQTVKTLYTNLEIEWEDHV